MRFELDGFYAKGSEHSNAIETYPVTSEGWAYRINFITLDGEIINYHDSGDHTNVVTSVKRE